MPPGGPAPAPGEVLPGPEAVDDIDIEELDRRAAAVSARIAALRAARA
jgi:hypothetical protein